MEQNFQNHRQIVKGFHLILGTLGTVGFIAAVVNVFTSCKSDDFLSSLIILIIFLCLILTAWYARVFALRAQDRAIRAEENFRHFLLTQKPLPSTLRMGQIIALRFAPDEEFPGLVHRASEEKLKAVEIKKAIVNWRADHYRV